MKPLKILYICTHNRCRSILSEAITNHLGNGRIVAKSAGSQPSGEVHPLSTFYLEEQGIATDALESQSWDEFEDFGADLVITVCDSAAGESCPLWFGKSLKMHWGLTDPSKLTGSEEDKADAFRSTIKEIAQRVQQLLKLDLENISPNQLQNALKELGAQ
ncbi:arsenate reductase ArsC [Lacimicrobium alkaliphilum]|uniref:Low molecular weight phosphatase n=1 Tax=Lacimicrobium alkaliphilum TaxID=1526571 RepID=A0ABQ1RC68_9ALTE|nr:arsenate reductase ArsC [Lacimicrobium alkaliphilum]GGD65616.1 low molecular weight phosphatase [Lacimicrobium alkaliphilum]